MAVAPYPCGCLEAGIAISKKISYKKDSAGETERKKKFIR
jgi:hypothetical protein